MKSKTKQRPAKSPRSAFADPAVDAVFSAYPKALRLKLMALRNLIFETAAVTRGVGELEETLKWGQPSYLTTETKSGSTIRLGEAGANQYAMYVHCQTDLVATFRELYPKELTYGGNRSIIFDADDDIPEQALRHCVALALTYHLNKRKLSRR
jgi:uncharacterized protein DUF1801